MVQVDIPLQAVIGQDLTAHLIGRVKAHVINGRTGELKHHRCLHGLRRLGHTDQCFVVIEIGSQHGPFPGLTVVEDFFDGFHRHY